VKTMSARHIVATVRVRRWTAVLVAGSYLVACTSGTTQPPPPPPTSPTISVPTLTGLKVDAAKRSARRNKLSIAVTKERSPERELTIFRQSPERT
jgi:hypothetical protein